jgi:hypothetical protein
MYHKLADLHVEVLKHPACSTDLALLAVHGWFAAQPKEYFLNG